jgi:hypothetical protein
VVPDHLHDDGAAGLVGRHPFDEPQIGLVVAESVTGTDLDLVGRIVEEPGAESFDHQVHELVAPDDLQQTRDVGGCEDPRLHRSAP